MQTSFGYKITGMFLHAKKLFVEIMCEKAHFRDATPKKYS